MSRAVVHMVLAAAVVGVSGGPAAAQFDTVGVYDEQAVATNRVDLTAAGVTLPVNRFTARVEEAYTRNFGGVMDGSILGGFPRYGVSHTKTVQLTPNDLSIGTPSAQATAISGTGSFAFHGPSAVGFGSITGGAAGERVVDAGFTILSSSQWSHPSFTATAVLDNGVRINSNTVAIPQGAGTNDTFFGFSAPAGRYINRLEVAYTNTNGFVRAWVDDIGFKTAVVGERLETGTLQTIAQATKSGTTYSIQSGGFNAQEVDFANVDRRGIMEFALPEAGGPVRVHEVLLEFNVNTMTSGSTLPELSVFGYAGDGVATPADATASSLLIGQRRIDDLGVFAVSLDPAYVEQLMNSGQDLGLLFRSMFDGHQVGVTTSGLAPTLTVRFTPVPEPAGVLATAAAAGWYFRRRTRRPT